MYATQLNMANYGRSVYCGKNTFSLFALSYSLSKVVSQQPENVFFGAYGFTVRAFYFVIFPHLLHTLFQKSIYN